ncbi:MAG: hypothetical protein RLZZ230_836 [Candidatus Parcubacteria bacterium]|jgi:hypothetical protein
MKNRFMALIISFSLLFSFVPSSAYAAAEVPLLYELASQGVCLKFKGITQLYCGVGIAFANYTWANRKNIVYVVAWSGGKIAKVTTPCMVLNGIRYYCI